MATGADMFANPPERARPAGRMARAAFTTALSLVAIVGLSFAANARPPTRQPTPQPTQPSQPTQQPAQQPSQQAQPVEQLPSAQILPQSQPQPQPQLLPQSQPPDEPSIAEPSAAGVATPLAPAPSASPKAASGLQPPQDPRLAQVFATFDANCAHCHQSGKLTGAAAGGSFANILDLDALAREPHLVRRGEPDASTLYQMLVDHHRPIDLGDPRWPAPDDIQRVRTWIEELPPAPATCASTLRVSSADVRAALEASVTAAGEAAATELRFVSLAHLANACATAVEMEAYRQAVAKLLNSLSWGAQPVALTPVDAAKSILAFKLSDIGWVAEHWDALARAEPKAIALDLAGTVTPPGGIPRPIRGDWLAYAASQAPFYAELLGLPPSLDELSRLLGIPREGEPGAVRTMRAGLKSSLLTRGPRVIERHQADTRRLWIVNDFIDGSGERDIFDRPLGGIRGAPERAQFRADGRRAIFTLPNGFLGYAIIDPDGRRLDQVSPRLEVDPAHSPGPTVAGLACISCHASGLKPFTDAMRSHVASERFTGTREVRDLAASAYDSGNDWLRVLDDDGYRFRRAMIQAAIDPDLSIHGLEPVAALARRYTLAVNLASLAAEDVSTPQAFDEKLAGVTLTERSLVPRLRQGLLSRSEANRLLAAVKTQTTDPGDGPGAPPPPPPSLRLALWTDKPVYQPGDLMTVYVQPSQPCFLTLVSVASTGKATVLFPNEFDADNLVSPRAVLAVPNEKAPYQFRMKDPGAETVVGSCRLGAKYAPGTEPDYERQRFTVLGNYENYLQTYLALDAEALRKARAARANPVKDAKLDTKDEKAARAAVRVTIR